MALEFTKTVSIINDTFTNLPLQHQTREGCHVSRKATCNDPTSRVRMALFATLLMNIKRICSSFQAQEVIIQSRVGDPEIAFGL